MKLTPEDALRLAQLCEERERMRRFLDALSKGGKQMMQSYLDAIEDEIEAMRAHCEERRSASAD